MTRATELESRGNVFTPFTGCAQIYHQRWYICAPFGEQVSLAMDNASKLAYAEGVVCLAAAKRGKGQQAPYAIPLRKLRLLPFSELCVQTKAKVRLLSAHKVYPCAPLLYRQNVGVVYG